MDRATLKHERLKILNEIDRRMALDLPVNEYGDKLLELTSERCVAPVAEIKKLKPHEGKALLLESMDYIVQERMKFRDWSDIGDDLGISSWAIRDHLSRWLKKEIIKNYPESEVYVNHMGKMKHLYVKLSKPKIFEMYENGLKAEEISADLDINVTTLREILKEQGVGKNERNQSRGLDRGC